MAAARSVVVAAAVTLLAVGVAGCGGGSEDDTAEVPCGEVMRQVAYEASRELAANGYAADPDALREAAPEGNAFGGEGDEVVLPAYDEFVADFDDGEQASVRSSLQSVRVGVGAVLDTAGLLEEISRSDGPCHGWIGRE